MVCQLGGCSFGSKALQQFQFGKKNHKNSHDKTDYWPCDYIFVSNLIMKIKIDILNIVIHVKTPN